MTASAMGRRLGVWWAGLVVAGAAAAATAHGLYAVAIASGVPAEIAVLYPVMTDGLALVAYSATSRLGGAARRYAWMVVLVAAGLSGLAQALYLAGDGMQDAPAAVRFGIGAVPAIAAAAVAHLLHLIRTASPIEEPIVAVQGRRAVQALPDVQPAGAGYPDPPGDVQAAATSPQVVQPVQQPHSVPARPAAGSATSRAEQAARRHRADHGTLPTTSELVRLTGVSRGTAGTVLKGLRTSPSTAPVEPPRLTDSDPTEHSFLEPDQSQPTHADHPSPPSIKIQNHYTPRHHDPEEDRLLPKTAASDGR